MVKSQDSGKLKKTKNRTWIIITVLAAAIIVCLAAYFYFFYFKNSGLAGIKSWITTDGSSNTLESALQGSSSGQSDDKPDLSIVEVTVERVETKSESESTNTSETITNNTISAASEAADTSADTTKSAATTDTISATTEATSDTNSETTETTTNNTVSAASEAADTSADTTSKIINTNKKKSGEIYIGDTVQFDILIKNNGTQPAKNIKVIDLPPDKLEYINISEGSKGVYDPFSKKIVLDIAEIGAGQTVKVTFWGFISNDLNDGETIENKVSALYNDESIVEKSTEWSVIGLPDYSATLVKVEDINGSKIWARDILKYTVIVKNTGKKTGGSVVLNCPVPPGTGYVDGTATGSGLTLSPNKSLLQFNAGIIEPGSQKEFSFKVFVAEYLTFSSDIKSGFFVTDGTEKISLENPTVTTTASVFQTVVCMGDSQVVLTDYPAQLTTLLNNQYSHAVFNVIPTGVKGEMANFAIQRFDRDVRIHNPDIIVIGYGCNDAGEPTGLYRYHMEILIRQAVSTGARVIVYGVGYIDMSISRWLGKANYTIFNEILKNDVCPKYGAVYVDLYSLMSKDYKTYIKEDGIHWTEEGATLVSGEVFKAITSVLDSEGRIINPNKK